MRPYHALSRWIVVSCSILLLLAQVLGMHYHRHIETRGGSHGHGVELHFEDGGLHVAESRADHQHPHHHGDGGGSSHGHLDVESKAVKAGLAKVFVDSLLLLLMPLLVAVMALGADMQVPARPRSVLGPSRFRLYSLRPPSQAPPSGPVFS